MSPYDENASPTSNQYSPTTSSNSGNIDSSESDRVSPTSASNNNNNKGDTTPNSDDLAIDVFNEETKVPAETDLQNQEVSIVDLAKQAEASTAEEERSKAHEKLLLYAYAALSTLLPEGDIVEKGAKDKEPVVYPTVLSPEDAKLRCEAMAKVLVRLGNEGIEVLKLNRGNQWQPRVLTITSKEIMQFKKSDDVRFNGFHSCPKGLLWLKKFDTSKATMSSIVNGKGGLLFNDIQRISVTNDKHSLSWKQKKGKFKNSTTLVLHTNDGNGSKRDVMFRCMNKEDAFALSSGFQSIIDRILASKAVVGQKHGHMANQMSAIDTTLPLMAKNKAFPSSKGKDRWEL